MKVLVTGGNGMIGKCLSEIVTDPSEWIFLKSKDCDLRNTNEVMNYFNEHKPTHVVHLAANVGGLYKNMREKVSMFRDNVRMNENVLEACNEYNVQRGIFVLTSCMYPCNPSKFPMDETMIHESEPHFSNEGYAYAKRMLEMQCRNYNEQYGRKYMCLIPVNLYGPHDNFNLEDSHVVPAAIHKLYLADRNGTDYTMFGTGTPVRQFLYSYDFCKIIVKSLLECESIKTLICCNNEVTIREMIELIAKCYDFKGNILNDTSKADGCMKKTVDNTELLKLYPNLEFTDLEKGLKMTVEWMKNNYDSCRK